MNNDITPNELQQKCIDKIDGKFLVLAGPGTGKTFTVVQRLKAMLNKNILPERILCLTFSETAASEMKNKLIKMLNKDININIYTYHGFCNEIIGQNAELFELPENYRVISETVSRQLLKEVIDETEVVEYRNDKNNPYVYLKIIKDNISLIKRYRYSKMEYFDNIEKNPSLKPRIYELKEKKIELQKLDNIKPKDIEKIDNEIEHIEKEINKACETWTFYENYKAKMEKENYIDFDDMIGFVLDKFESSPMFLDKISSMYDYIMVDEYQDTNESQNKIVFKLAEKNNNVFVVGDDDQIIYSFQGANLDTIEGFLNHFPDTEVICLKENMRSTQSILDVARIVAKQDDRRLEANKKFINYGINKDLVAKNKDVIKKDKPVELTIFQNQEQEYNEIVNDIEKIINSDICPKDNDNNKKLSEIAVITTGNDQLAVFAEKLKDKNIPFELKDGKSIFEIKSSLVLFYYLQMLANEELYSDKILKFLLLTPFNIHPCDFSKLYEKITLDKTFIETMKSTNDWVEKDKIDNFLRTYDYLKNYISKENVRNIVMEVGEKTGIFKYYINDEINQNENIAGLKKLVDEATNFSNINSKICLMDFIDYLLTIQEDSEMDITTDKPNIEMNAVQLTTYHSSKGKEYEYVYMPSMQKTRFESSSKSFKPTIPVGIDKYKTDEEWKLYKFSDRIKTIYVGMTRAKHSLKLSYYLNSNKKSSQPTSYILEANDLYNIKTYEDKTIENYYKEMSNSLVKREYDYKRDFKDLIQAKMKNRYYSPSLLNSYQGCPRRFLYSEILNLDARIGIQDSANYGNSVHNACEYMVNYAINNKSYPTKDDFIKKFQDEMNHYPYSTQEQRKIFEDRGKKELDEFYDYLTIVPIENLYKTEFTIKTEIDGIKFTGRIDRIEKNQDGTFNIIDYKTSKSCSKKSISNDGTHKDYFNQMCLYKYFFEKTSDKLVKETAFMFPINCSTASIQLTKEECDMVVEELKQAIKDINDAKFEPSYKKEVCQYCAYKDFCSLDII